MVKFASYFLDCKRMDKFLLLMLCVISVLGLNAQNMQTIDFEQNGGKFFTFNYYEYEVIPNEFHSTENTSNYIVKLSRTYPLSSLGGIAIELIEPIDVVGDIKVELKYLKQSEIKYVDIKLEENDNVAFTIQKSIFLENDNSGWQRITCQFQNINGYFSKLVIVPAFNTPGLNTIYLDEINIRY